MNVGSSDAGPVIPGSLRNQDAKHAIDRVGAHVLCRQIVRLRAVLVQGHDGQYGRFGWARCKVDPASTIAAWSSKSHDWVQLNAGADTSVSLQPAVYGTGSRKFVALMNEWRERAVGPAPQAA